MAPLIGLITCSQRTPRAGPQISAFIHKAILESHPTANVQTIDLAEWNLPLYNEPGIPSFISSADGYVHEHTRAWSREISRYEAFVFVTPQYNWGYPASIKNAIDYLYNEWKGKPALVASYGGHGGGKAAAQLRQVLEGLRMRPLERMVALTFPGKEDGLKATKGEDLGLEGEAGFWDGEKEGIQEAFGELVSAVEGGVIIPMLLLSAIFYSFAGFSLAATALPSSDNHTIEETITCDVCIIGGGGSGTYAAIRLKDEGKHVVVVERNNRLGGHTETYYLPDGSHVDYGVEGAFNDQVSRNFFTRLGVKWKQLVPLKKRTDYVDFTTGERVDPPSGLIETGVATFLYRSAIKQYTFLNKGVYDLPDPVPEDLVRPFGEFMQKNSLEAAIPMVFFFGQNVGNLLEMPLLYAVQNFGVPHIDALVQGYITPLNGVYELFRKAGRILGSDVLFQTTVAEAKRSDSGVELTVEHTDGSRKLIKAKKLLITIPPIMKNLKDFDLDETETELFKKWFWRTYYVAVLNNTGLPDAIYVSNADPGTGPGNLPQMPFDYLLQYMGVSGYPTSKLVGDMNFTAEEAKKLLISDFSRMKRKATYPIQNPEIVAFEDHSPETLMVTPEEIRNGYYRKLYALQGRRNTYYTGLTFCSDYTSLLWGYTNTVLDKMG
ncbi:hypothetical protein BO70DRAFT_395730 [Aspergillus heteromorphus CBS 117.55]|uniref:NADPH-dependent FMN reductase Lot6 n=1 Tax=Aspergillus heteromorphus CBS 117.55 TaxID=1448321 RepID=A0A317WFI9_9EURO|nr:uncharacterized protein BO70DRAFT_395730 [Aspergillus heteromorphus CBS 117.55]PWY85059.1 hypothetical protein BO70DRAFT_395730 [Aspergillus heteromorphus CBS 117.55]